MHLFPVEAPEPGLIGIARLAARSQVLDSKRRTSYLELPAEQWITRVTARHLPFRWSINPYRGCEFGCKYCYARYTHEFMELRETEQFERLIFAKSFSRDRFRRELSRIRLGEGIAIGTATDPYQPAERRYGVTRKILRVLADERGRSFSLATKSDLVARDSELLAAIGSRNRVTVMMTITTVDEELARVLEPYAPRPALRLGAVRQLSEAGVPVVILACPVMPLINDSHASLSAVAEEAARAGAVYLFGNPLFLKPCAQKAFFPMLEQHFPHLTGRYGERYSRAPYLDGRYPELIGKRISAIREQFGLNRKPHGPLPEAWDDGGQLPLFAISSQVS